MRQPVDKYVQIYPNGEVWYAPPGKPRQQLNAPDTNSLCGSGWFETGIEDVFLFACQWHDRAYMMRAFFEDRGFNRAMIDHMFYEFCLQAAGDNELLKLKAAFYYDLVREFGAFVYYRHPAGSGSTLPTAEENVAATPGVSIVARIASLIPPEEPTVA